MRAHRLPRFQMDRHEETGFGRGLFPASTHFVKSTDQAPPKPRSAPIAINAADFSRLSTPTLRFFFVSRRCTKGPKNDLYLLEVTMPSRPISHTDIAELTSRRPLLESLALLVGAALSN